MPRMSSDTIKAWKEKISAQTGYPVDLIRLFGSRVTGGAREDSDLDVAIFDPKRMQEDLCRFDLDGITVEIRFIEMWDLSWIKGSV